MSLKEARTFATAVQASKSRHNSKAKPLIVILPNLLFINARFQIPDSRITFQVLQGPAVDVGRTAAAGAKIGASGARVAWAGLSTPLRVVSVVDVVLIP